MVIRVANQIPFSHSLFAPPMKELGLGLLIIGLISLVLAFINPNVQYVFLKWVNNWGPTVAWVIRGGITLLGLVLWLGFKNRE